MQLVLEVSTEEGEEGMLHRQLRGWAFLVSWGLVAAWAGTGPAVVVQAAEAAKTASSPQEALNVYSDAASLQNNGAFELAAEDWEKFLQKFPKDPLAAKAQHYLGVCNLQLKRLDKAAVGLRRRRQELPQL